MEPFTTILADPGWRYDDALRQSDVRRSSQDQYTTQSVEAICDLYVPSTVRTHGRSEPGRLCGHPVGDHAFLWLWTTSSFLLDGSAARVCNAWGFIPKQIITWVKARETGDAGYILHIGMGHYTRNCTEHLILATRGKVKSLIQTKSEPNVIFAPRTKHSEKPEVVYDLVERLCPGPYLELFARGRPRPGWTAWGNQVERLGTVGDPLPEPALVWP